VHRRNVQCSKEAKGRKGDQSEEKEHLNLWVKSEKVKSQESDFEDSKKVTPLLEENLQDTPLPLSRV